MSRVDWVSLRVLRGKAPLVMGIFGKNANGQITRYEEWYDSFSASDMSAAPRDRVPKDVNRTQSRCLKPAARDLLAISYAMA